MKIKLFVVAILTVALLSAAGTPTGTNVGAGITPTDSTDIYPTHNALWGQGGFREVYDTNARNSIPALRRDTGMVVFCNKDSTSYQLRGGIANANWKIYASMNTVFGNGTNNNLTKWTASNTIGSSGLLTDAYGNLIIPGGGDLFWGSELYPFYISGGYGYNSVFNMCIGSGGSHYDFGLWVPGDFPQYWHPLLIYPDSLISAKLNISNIPACSASDSIAVFKSGTLAMRTRAQILSDIAALGLHAKADAATLADSATGSVRLGGQPASYHDTVGHGGKLNLHAKADSTVIADSAKGIKGNRLTIDSLNTRTIKTTDIYPTNYMGYNLPGTAFYSGSGGIVNYVPLFESFGSTAGSCKIRNSILSEDTANRSMSINTITMSGESTFTVQKRIIVDSIKVRALSSHTVPTLTADSLACVKLKSHTVPTLTADSISVRSICSHATKTLTADSVFSAKSNWYASSSFPCTLSGCTATLAGTAYYIKIGNFITMLIPALIGTSNTNDCFFKGIPSIISNLSSTQVGISLTMIDNGAVTTATMLAQNQSYWQIMKGVGTSWTTSGSKGFSTTPNYWTVSFYLK
jgi:hypothetical protein